VLAQSNDYYVAATDDDNAGDNAYYPSTSGDEAVDLNDTDFVGMSIMPISCVNYNDSHMIKFDMFESENNFQCHANSVGTYVVSISHFMRHYFNYQSLVLGNDFELPSDVGYLNCVKLDQTTEQGETLYAMIGCLERETYTRKELSLQSNRFSLHLYTEKSCSTPFDDRQTDLEHSTVGYNIDGETFETQVSFHPSFFACKSCKPQSISNSFSKGESSWIDDDATGYNRDFDDWADDIIDNTDDVYATVLTYTNNEVTSTKEDDDEFYTVNDDDNARRISVQKFTPAEDGLEKFERDLWKEQRELEDYNIDDSVVDWNICSKVYTYSEWCDKDCQSLGYLSDQWSSTDLILLGVMCILLASIMGLIKSNRSKVYRNNMSNSDWGEKLPINDGNSPSSGQPSSCSRCCFYLGTSNSEVFKETMGKSAWGRSLKEEWSKASKGTAKGTGLLQVPEETKTPPVETKTSTDDIMASRSV